MSKRIQFTLDFEKDLDKYLQNNYQSMVDYRVLSKALDARGANRGKRPFYNYHVEIIYAGDNFTIVKETFKDLGALKEMPIIVGAGPCGLFCALRLMEYGIPSIIIERGETAHKRMHAVSKFWRYGEMNTENNVCYGEGGAGLFSDGKLITRIKSPYVQYVMNRFVDFGAPKETAYTSNPHLGSNKIRSLIHRISDYLKQNGCQFHYNTLVKELLIDSKKIVGVKLGDGKKMHGANIVLASGHSAKEVYEHLKDVGVALKAKSFAVGVRVEHPRKLMNKIQYGQYSDNFSLQTARYRLSYHNKKSDHGTYSFCMCPGGYVLSSGTDKEGIVVNGMSNYSQRSPWSNAALVVSVKAGEDFQTEDVLNGMKLQHEIEHKAYKESVKYASGKEVPAQKIKDFLDNKRSSGELKSSCPSKTFSYELKNLFPQFIEDHLKEALLSFDRQMKGFVSNEALLLAPETRTSSPVTILRDRECLESVNIQGLYPGGEGAGYAGGITSAAVDGVNIAMAIILKEKDYVN